MVFTKIVTYSEPVFDSDNWNQTRSPYNDFEAANNAGLHDACMSIVSHVAIWQDGHLRATWSRNSNYWFILKNKSGRFISIEKYFEARRVETERSICLLGYNVRIRGNNTGMTLHAGSHIIKFRPDMLPVIGDTVEELWLKSLPWSDNEVSSIDTDIRNPIRDKEMMDSLAVAVNARLGMPLI